MQWAGLDRGFLCPPPEGGREVRLYGYGMVLVPQGRASIGGAGVELPRVVVVVVVVPLLLLVVEFPPALRVARGPWTMRSLRRSSRRRSHPRCAAWPHAVWVRCLYTPLDPAALVEKNWMWSAARAEAVTWAFLVRPIKSKRTVF